MKYLLLVCLPLTGLFANAQKLTPPAVKPVALYNKNMVQIKPVYKNYVTQTAKAFSKQKPNIDSLKKTMKAPGKAMFANLTSTDIETLTFLILQAAETAVYADIKNMMGEMEKKRRKKEALRKEEERINETLRKAGDSNKVKIPAYNIDQEKRLAKIKDEKDALNEMAAQDMLMLQQLMEKENQLEQMISNIMKAQGDSLNTISNNLKAS